MQENRNAANLNGQRSQNCGGGYGTVCIDTKRVLDSCRDRDCFEDTRVYLTATGESVLASCTNLRTRRARLLWAYVGVEEIPFNCGFYEVKIRYYIELDLEACVAVGKSQGFKGLAVLDKEVILYGGEGRAVSFTSGGDNSYCGGYNTDNIATNAPVAVVETVDPIVLGSRVVECGCHHHFPCDCADIPEGVLNSIGEELIINGTNQRLLVSLGVFSVIRMERPAQILVNAADYSVPDKECIQATSNDNPCSLFKTIAFPINQFRGTDRPTDNVPIKPSGGCGCRG